MMLLPGGPVSGATTQAMVYLPTAQTAARGALFPGLQSTLPCRLLPAVGGAGAQEEHRDKKGDVPKQAATSSRTVAL